MKRRSREEKHIERLKDEIHHTRYAITCRAQEIEAAINTFKAQVDIKAHVQERPVVMVGFAIATGIATTFAVKNPTARVFLWNAIKSRL